jgi:DNA-binding Lrp family transcriptional regulator
MKALILIKLASLESRDAYYQLRRLDAVTDSYMMYGRYDAVLILQGKDLAEVHDIILTQVQPVSGVIEILPCIIVEHDGDTSIHAKPQVQTHQTST